MNWGAFADATFWKDTAKNLKGLPETLKRYGQIPEEADRIAEDVFPDSARDASTKNAFRHALGTGMLTQALGGNAASAAAAKVVGWGWELPTLLDRNATDEQRVDSRHDLNANAVGAATARKTGSQAELVEALKRLAVQSAPVAPPGAFEASPGHLTRTVR